jgi:capsular exopolysaccharide synthesis family protein
VLVAGTMAPNPSELLASDAMQQWLQTWREEFDFVVLDGTPVLPVTDSVILDALCDMTILLVKSRNTERQQVTQAYRTLMNNRQRYIGVVLNCISPQDQSYYGYYGYYGYKKDAYAKEQNRA